MELRAKKKRGEMEESALYLTIVYLSSSLDHLFYPSHPCLLSESLFEQEAAEEAQRPRFVVVSLQGKTTPPSGECGLLQLESKTRAQWDDCTFRLHSDGR